MVWHVFQFHYSDCQDEEEEEEEEVEGGANLCFIQSENDLQWQKQNIMGPRTRRKVTVQVISSNVNK